MSQKQLVVIAGLVLFTVGAFGFVSLRARELKNDVVADGSFDGKTVVVQTKDGRGAMTLASVRLKKLGDQLFIGGKETDVGNLTKVQFGGRTIWLPFSSVSQIVEMEK